LSLSITGDFKDFRKHTVGPIKRAFADDDCEKLVSTSAATDSEKRLQLHEVSAEGLRLLCDLHKQVSIRLSLTIVYDLVNFACCVDSQVMPFILRRSKEIALPELPPKIIVDVFCPLSRLQRILYAQFQRGLQISDDSLEKELIDRLPELLAGSAVVKEEGQRTGPSYHPFQALSYLKRLCVHPLLVKDICDASTLLTIVDDDTDMFASGKLCQLVTILTEQGIVFYSNETSRLRVQKRICSMLRPGEEVSQDEVFAESDSDDDESASESDNDDDASDDGPSVTVKVKAQREKASSDLQRDARKKCLIFAEHRATLDVIEKEVFQKIFPKEKILLLDGRVDANTRARAVAAFNSESHSAASEMKESPNILLLTVASCGLGLNLSAAEVVIFVEHSWNPFVDLQAMDRVHRFGQRKSATIFRILGESDRHIIFKLWGF
jgi:TATA-binding protein-associated factor